MKATYLYTAGAVVVTFVLAACVSNAAAPAPQIAVPETTIAAPAPAPVTAPTAEPAPPPPVQEPFFEYYLDAPQTPGRWGYTDDPGETLATYGIGQNYGFIIRCDKSTRQIGLARVAENASPAPRAMDVTTETTTRALTAEPLTGTGHLIAVELDPRDPLLDAMAITKGRFAVGVEGEHTLYLPAWAEVTRVIEDCR